VFRDDDNAAGAQPRGVVVNETFVRRYVPDGDALGTTIANVGEGAPTTIIGVVADSKTFGAANDVPAEVYMPLSAMAFSQVHLALRVPGDPAQHAATLRDALGRWDAGVPILQLRPLDEAIAQTDPFQQFNLDLMLAFSAVALLLTAFGVYAVIAYLVAQRRAELGIRMSLGADAGRIVTHVLGQGMKPVAAGVAVGSVGALLLGQVLSNQLFGLGRIEPGVLGSVIATLVGVALLATALPAWRATRIPAVEVLRSN
jgi:putative ABC transport system permease protein